MGHAQHCYTGLGHSFREQVCCLQCDDWKTDRCSLAWCEHGSRHKDHKVSSEWQSSCLRDVRQPSFGVQQLESKSNLHIAVPWTDSWESRHCHFWRKTFEGLVSPEFQIRKSESTSQCKNPQDSSKRHPLIASDLVWKSWSNWTGNRNFAARVVIRLSLLSS